MHIDHCCTYIPDDRGNWTLIRGKIQQLRNFLYSQEDNTPQWTFLSWLNSGNWWQIILKILTPVCVILLLFCVFTTCVIPCIRHMVSRMITTTMTTTLTAEHIQLLILDQDDDTPDDYPEQR